MGIIYKIAAVLLLGFYFFSYGVFVYAVTEEIKEMSIPLPSPVEVTPVQLSEAKIVKKKFPLSLAPPDEKDEKKYGWWYYGNNEHMPVRIDPEFLRLINKYRGIYLGDIEQKVIYLTFDEGYENGYTGCILDVLKEEGVTAAFFITGSYLQKNVPLVLRMVEEGHLVCNHSVHHYSMPELDREKMKAEVLNLDEAFQKVTGEKMAPFFRPPMGEFSGLSLRITAELGYYTVFWSFAYRDWEVAKQKGKEYALQQVTEHCHPGAVLLLHAVSSDNAGALLDIIRELKDRGYKFLPLTELLYS